MPPRRTLLRLLPIVTVLIAAAITAILVARNRPKPLPAPTVILGAKAPDFSLRDARKPAADPPVTLSLLAENGPVVILFTRGFGNASTIAPLQTYASHMPELAQVGLQLLVVSPWTAANIRDSLQDANFAAPFPILCDSDPENKVAAAYDLQTNEFFLSGIFLIDKDRRVQFLSRAETPFTDIPALIAAAKKLPR